MTKPYQPFDHTADIGVLIRGDSLEQLFENGAFAFTDTLVGVDRVRPAAEQTLEIAAGDLEELMVNWLSELLYLFEAEKQLFGEFRVAELTPERLVVNVRGEPYDEERHPVATDLKAVTYHGLKVLQNDRGQWEATVIFDV